MIEKALRLIEDSQHILILTHKNPDADTLGSALGIYHTLKTKKVTVFNKSTDIQNELKSIPGFGKIKREFPKIFDLVIAVDGADFARFGLDEDEIAAIQTLGAPILNIDHHQNNTLFGNVNLVDSSACATGLLVYKLLVQGGYTLDSHGGEALFYAIASDSGFFGYERVDDVTFGMASELCKLGVDPNKIYITLKASNSLAKVRLIQKSLASLELHAKGRCAIMSLHDEDFKESGAKRSDCEGIVNFALSLASVRLGILLRSEESGEVRVSFRSKGNLDTNLIAQIFGGGGHRNASGASAKNITLDSMKQMIINCLEGFFDE